MLNEFVSTRTGDLVEAEALLSHRSLEARRLHLYGRTFREAGNKFVAESQHLRGLDRDERALAVLYPFIPLSVRYLCSKYITRRSYQSCEQGSTRV
jgi:hypothetical protein